MKRREFITGFGGVAAANMRPGSALAQHSVPVIGFLNSASPEAFTDRLRGFRQGLKESSFAEGDNVSIIYRWAENQIGRLPELAAELVRWPVTVIAATGGSNSALAVKAATTSIPFVFGVPEDPVKLGLVKSLARPQGNATGVNFYTNEVLAKRLALLRELVPGATRVAVIVNPSNVAGATSILSDVEGARVALGMQIRVINASTSRDIDAAFASFTSERPDALFVAPDPLFFARRVQLANLSSHHAIPATFSTREIAEAGGLMSYGTNITDAYRQVGVYIGRILKGAKPADLPVLQTNKFELIINSQTARMLGIAVPSSLLARADEVIE
jgi:putative ABC transport system substrate-binding protein